MSDASVNSSGHTLTYAHLLASLQAIGDRLRKHKRSLPKALPEASQALEELLQTARRHTMNSVSPASRLHEAQLHMNKAALAHHARRPVDEAQEYLTAGGIWAGVERERKRVNFPTADDALARSVLCTAMACGALLGTPSATTHNPIPPKLMATAADHVCSDPGTYVTGQLWCPHLSRAWAACYRTAALLLEFGCCEMAADYFELAAIVVSVDEHGNAEDGGTSSMPHDNRTPSRAPTHHHHDPATPTGSAAPSRQVSQSLAGRGTSIASSARPSRFAGSPAGASSNVGGGSGSGVNGPSSAGGPPRGHAAARAAATAGIAPGFMMPYVVALAACARTCALTQDYPRTLAMTEELLAYTEHVERELRAVVALNALRPRRRAGSTSQPAALTEANIDNLNEAAAGAAAAAAASSAAPVVASLGALIAAADQRDESLTSSNNSSSGGASSVAGGTTPSDNGDEVVLSEAAEEGGSSDGDVEAANRALLDDASPTRDVVGRSTVLETVHAAAEDVVEEGAGQGGAEAAAPSPAASPHRAKGRLDATAGLALAASASFALDASVRAGVEGAGAGGTQPSQSPTAAGPTVHPAHHLLTLQELQGVVIQARCINFCIAVISREKGAAAAAQAEAQSIRSLGDVMATHAELTCRAGLGAARGLLAKREAPLSAGSSTVTSSLAGGAIPTRAAALSTPARTLQRLARTMDIILESAEWAGTDRDALAADALAATKHGSPSTSTTAGSEGKKRAPVSVGGGRLVVLPLARRRLSCRIAEACARDMQALLAALGCRCRDLNVLIARMLTSLTTSPLAYASEDASAAPSSSSSYTTTTASASATAGVSVSVSPPPSSPPTGAPAAVSDQ